MRAVEAWRQIVTEELSAAGLDYPVATILALIQVESAGDARARRPRSQFCGLLQMGRLAGIDVGLRDRAADTTAELLGDGRRAIALFLRYQDRYKARHRGEGWAIAALWKGGPGTMRRVWAEIDAGKTRAEALEIAQREVPLPNLVEYVSRYERFLVNYEKR